MAPKLNTQLTRQVGEHLVTAELGRKEILASPFAGNVPHIDILAYKNGKSIPLQVKAINGGDWQFTIDKFINIQFVGDIQVLGEKNNPIVPHLICVFVLLSDEYSKDKFMIFEWEQLQDIVVLKYGTWLKTIGGRRPKNPKSLHCTVTYKDLAEFEDNWTIITNKFE
jgi:hypothetical protein